MPHLPSELTAEQLRRHCQADQFPFASTAEGPALQGIIGQERATRAIDFGLAVPYPGYNIYAMGPSGSGKHSIITHFLRAKAAARPVPPDWGYADNFDGADCPIAVRLPPAGGTRLREQIDHLLAQVAEALAATFRSDQYAEKRNALARELSQRRDACWLDQQIASATICPLFEDLDREYAAWPDVTAHLARIQAHMIDHVDELKRHYDDRHRQPDSPYDRYRLNVLVDHQGLEGAPVVEETNPTYANLVGRVELHSEFGTWVTNYREIKAGALHRANGGYLILDARTLLRQPLAWEALKRALGTGQVRIEDMGQPPGVFAPATLTPAAIPLDVKVVLMGESSTYYLLYAYDDQFEKLFKVRADFAVEMAWTAANELRIAEFIHSRCEEEGLLHFDLSGVARVIEYSARLVEDQRRLSTRFARIYDIVREAAFWAKCQGHSLVTGDDVSKAVCERIYRSNQFEERVRDMIADGTIMIDTAGAVVGQVNGLAVLQLGDYAFGKPTRITAATYQGRSGVINIEREARLSGRIHDKGMLILAGILGSRYAQDKPLSLSASIAFEQSYEGVDGDSASSAELYALLSSLAGLPIRQDLAVTGSVNQRGEVQAVGGVTAKVEGFFDVCRAAPGGLTGAQGVILPAANVANLMLREDVVDAVARGRFHLYPIREIDEGLELLTGVAAGQPGPEGLYPPGSVNGRVDRQLRDLADRLQKSGQASVREKTTELAVGRSDKEPPHEPELPGEQPEPVEREGETG